MDRPLGIQVAEARRRSSKTLRALAAELDVSPALLSLIEQGKQDPSRDLVEKLAAKLGGDADGWCALIGRVRPELESRLAELAKTDPDRFRVFRTLLDWGRRSE